MTLYKYLPDVEAILLAWHERQVTGHLEQFAEVRDRTGDAAQRLQAVIEAYALMAHQHHSTPLVTVLHRGAHVDQARRYLSNFVRDLVAEGAEAGDLRDDVAPQKLANYCLHALHPPAACLRKPRSGDLSWAPWPGCVLSAEFGICRRRPTS